MLDSARSILDNYIDTSQISRFTFYSVEMVRGENPEDLFYLCTLKDQCYVVFETDYLMNPLSDVAHEASDIFKSYDLSPLHWIVKKESQSKIGSSAIPIDADTTDDLQEGLIFNKEGSASGYAVRYAVLELTDTANRKQARFHPNAYGSTS